jgi:hypothetical protein
MSAVIRIPGIAFLLILALALAGCASVPPGNGKESPNSVATPTLSLSQVNELLKSAKTPQQLGIEVQTVGQSAGFRGMNEVSLAQSATVPLVELPTTASDPPSARYRVPFILATVNGRENQRVLLDSGSNRALLGYSLAHNLNVPLIAGLDPVHAQGIGGQGQVDAYWGIVGQVAVGGLELRKMLALVAPDAEVLTYRRSFWGNAQIMILGVIGLRRLSYLSIDYLRGVARFEVREPYVPDADAKFVSAVSLRWEGDLPVVDAVLERTYPTSCVLDTGGDYGLFLPRAVGTQLGYWKPGWGSEATSHGIAGEAEGKGYLVHEVKVGGAIFRQVPAGTRTDGPEPIGGRVLLGNYELRRYRVTFDFKKNVVWLEQ